MERVRLLCSSDPYRTHPGLGEGISSTTPLSLRLITDQEGTKRVGPPKNEHSKPFEIANLLNNNNRTKLL